MITGMRRITLALTTCGYAAGLSAQGMDNAMRRAEERQMIEEAGPRAEYNRAVKEANAAYAEAVRECGRMASGQRATCMQEARANLQNDLASARAQSSQGSPMRR